eukprot:4206750-Alexandrium_andersonii.AAC.1
MSCVSNSTGMRDTHGSFNENACAIRLRSQFARLRLRLLARPRRCAPSGAGGAAGRAGCAG